MSDLKLRIDILGRDFSDDAIKNAISGLEKLGAKATDTDDKLRGKRGAKARQSFDVAGNLSLAADNLDRIGRGARNALRMPLEASIAFEKKMADVAAVAGATPDELEKLTKEARRLGATSMFSATEAGEGQEFLAMAGFDVQQNLKALPDVLNLAAAGNLELGRASDISSDILTAFGMKAEQMQTVVDQLTQTFTKSNTTMDLLGQTMSYVAPIAAGAKVSLAQTAAAAGVLGDSGIKGSKAGTALRAMLLRLKSPPKQVAAALKGMGDATKNAIATGDFSQLPEILAEIDAGLAKMKPERAAAFMKKLFGEEPSSGLEVLMKAAREGTLQDKVSLVENSQGRAAQIARDKSNTSAGKIKEAQSRFEDLMIETGNNLIPLMNELLPVFNEFVSSLSAFVKENPKAVQTLGKMLLGVGLVAPAFSAVARTGSAAATTIGLFGSAANAVTKASAAPGLVGKLASVMGPAGLVLAAGAAGVAVGKLADDMFGISDWLSQTGKTEVERGSSRLKDLGQALTKDEREKRNALIRDLDQARADTSHFEGMFGVGDAARVEQLQAELARLENTALARHEKGRSQKTEVGGTLKVEIDDNRTRVKHMESKGGLELEVDTGKQMMW